MAKSGIAVKTCGYDGGSGSFSGFGFGARRGGLQTDQMQFCAVQKFPLNLIAWLETNGGGQSHGKADIESLILALGTNGLNAQGVSGLHFEKIYLFACLFLC
jgi:hypothetical protein